MAKVKYRVREYTPTANQGGSFEKFAEWGLVRPLATTLRVSESGLCARRTPIEWFRGLRDACRRWNTPFFFKQWGTWGADGIKRSKKENGSILDGETFKEYPKR